MAGVKETGYLFIHSFNLDERDISVYLDKTIEDIHNNIIPIKPVKYYVNVVCNKNNEKLGYSYIWTDNEILYNLLLGNNIDGTERYEEIDDPNWVQPDFIEDENIENDWSIIANDEERMTRPKIKNYLEPLINNNIIIKLEEDYDVTVNINPLLVKTDRKKLNQLFSKETPSWVTKKMLYNFFSKFEKDKNIYYGKNNKKFHYPIVKIKRNDYNNNNLCTIIFSPSNPTASFLVNLTKKVIFQNQNNKELIFFSQSKR
jgi:hypothetical protein